MNVQDSGRHSGHGPHELTGDHTIPYSHALEAAQPDPGRDVVALDLEAREVEWSFAPGLTLPAWAYNGRIPGPLIEARVGDVLEVRFTNRLPEPTNVHW